MSHPKNLRIEDYIYDLPENRIAKFPLEQREKSKLLIYRNGGINESQFENIVEELPANCLLVYNNTKVFYARLQFLKSTGAKIEVFCLEPDSIELTQAMQQKRSATWKCMVGNAKKWKDESLVLHSPSGVKLTASLIGKEGNDYVIQFQWEDEITFSELIEQLGKVPLPPYLKREAEEEDKHRYQTVYSIEEGSVAAPTAGLHFTEELLQKLEAKGIGTLPITLHVGAGTFQPVKSETMRDHDMHAESFSFHLDQLITLRDHLEKGKPIVVVGTTSMRALESLFWIGNEKVIALPAGVDQWTPYDGNITRGASDALSFIIDYLQKNWEGELMGKTSIIIAPGYQFRFADALITNFHQPKSTLLLLVSALVGNDWQSIYDYALGNGFRFLSYGDSSLLWKNNLRLD
ncbi:MAG: S-adenosylmethionine tRNA ribosyltransferase [Crocinitomicaceae bacterium]|nr:S-adenosylmethionine tRNA ribosyltransferase [Crocinitomicaceae bacterium]